MKISLFIGSIILILVCAPVLRGEDSPPAFLRKHEGGLRKTTPADDHEAVVGAKELVREGNYNKALSILSPFTLEPLKYPTAVSDYLVILVWDGRLDEAIQMYESLPPSFPRRNYLMRNLAKAYYDKKEFLKALSLYDISLALAPFNEESRKGIVLSLINTGDYNRASDYLTEFLANAPDSVPLNDAKAYLLAWQDSISANTEGNDISHQETKEQNKPFFIFTAPSVKLLSEYYTNSSDFTRKSAGAEFGFSAAAGLHFETGYVNSNFSQDGFEDILRHTLFIQGEKQLSESITLLARLSENFYDNDNANLNGGLFVRYQPLANVFTEFSFRHFDIIDTVLPFNNVIYSYVVTIGSLDRDIQSDDYKFYLLYNPFPKVSLAGEFIYGDYSDSNEKRSLMFEAGYQVLDNPYLRAAYNYFYLDIKDPAPLVRNKGTVESAYWDPLNFETHTLRLQFRQDYNKHLSFGAETALSYSPKNSGLSKSAFLSASYKFMEQLSLRLDARWFDQNKGVDRLGKTDRFWATNYTIAFQYIF